MKNYFEHASSVVFGCMGLGGEWAASSYSSEHVKQANNAIEAALNTLEFQLRESINKGWNSIEVSKYEKFNNIENNAAEYPKRAEKILENMKTHARMLGEDSSYYNDPKYGEEYKNILNEQ